MFTDILNKLWWGDGGAGIPHTKYPGKIHFWILELFRGNIINYNTVNICIFTKDIYIYI